MRRWRRWLGGVACVLCASACGSGVGSPIRGPAVAALNPADAGAVSAQPDAGGDVPAGSHCAAVAHWPDSAAQAELELIAALNRERSDRHSACFGRMSDTTSGPQQPSPILPVLQVTALQLAPELRCSARLHTQDMLQRHFVSQVNPDGQDPGQRMTAAGFSHGPFAEAIVAHATDAAHVLSSLLADDRVCRSLSTMQLTAIGVGHDEDLWTLDFAGP